MIYLRGLSDGAADQRCWLLIVLVLVLAGCESAADYRKFSGTTMGTYYTVTCRCERDVADVASLQAAIDAALVEVNAQMSTYDPDSTLSRFNAAPAGEWFEVEPDLAEVTASALTLSRQSQGAFDVTVGPLVNAWGFGPESGAGDSTLPPAQLAELLERVGFHKLEVRLTPPALFKTANVYVDLSAIAKGFGVDRLAGLLETTGCADYLVDVGGEVRVRGMNPAGQRWRIGVEVPDPGSTGRVQQIVRLTDQAVATSGDYRNFRDIDGVRLSHTIDPRNGRPVEHGLASVTVVHESAMWADGYATAINVLGPEAGLAFAEHRNLAALLVIRSPDGFIERYTVPMTDLLVSP